MKDTLTSFNQGDFHQRYAGTIGWLLRDDKRKLVYVSDVTREYVYFEDITGFRFNLKADSGIYFEFIPVDRGWFNAKSGKVYMLERHPARQWRRGVCPGNTYIYQLTTKLNARMGITLSHMSDIFEDNDPTIPKNWSKYPLAISKHFAIGGDKTLYFYNRVIGKVDDTKLVLESDLFYQEVSDQVRRKELPFKVVING